jgi:hypothetical protein
MVTKKTTFKGMVEMFTTPREKEDTVVKSILRSNGIKFRSQEERRENGLRFCIYVPHQSVKRAYTLIDEGLMDHGM